MLKKTRLHAELTGLQLFFIVTVILTIAAAWAMAGLYGAFSSGAPVDKGLLISHYRDSVFPKPMERFVFLVLALGLPVTVFAGGIFFFRRSTGFAKTSAGFSCLLMFVVISLLYLPWLGFNVFFNAISILKGYRYLQIIIPFVALCAAAFWYSSGKLRILSSKPLVQPVPGPAMFPGQSKIWLVFLSLVLLQIVSWRLLGGNSVTRDLVWHVEADAFFYSIGQVAAGKTLLADFPSQYGFYSMILQPLFAIIGLSVFKVSAVLAVLQVVSLAAVLSVVLANVRDAALRWAYALALVAATFGTMLYLIGWQNFYYQYWPIRFFWPAVALLAFYRYTLRHTLWHAAAVSVCGALGSLWNPDTGLVIVISFAGVLTARWFVLWVFRAQSTEQERMHVLKAMGLHVAIFIACALLAAAWLTINAESAIRWSDLTSYHKTFYGLGFMMLPLPIHPSPWMAVLGVYLMGLLVAVQLWASNPYSRFAELLLFLMLLGLGLFVYYQGRAHPLNLVSVCWPAITMTVLLADRALRAVKAGLLARHCMAYPVAALSVLLMLSVLLIACVPRMLSSAAVAVGNLGKPTDALVSGELLFIRKHTRPGDKCAILAARQGIYHVETGTASPLSGPGYAEMLLQKDLESFVGQLSESPPSCVFIGMGPFSGLRLGIDLLKVLEPHYMAVDRSDTGTMILARPIKQGAPEFKSKKD